MALENLKSIFTDGIKKFTKTDLLSFESKLTEGAKLFDQSEGLRKLNSIFTQDIDNLASNFESGQPQNSVDTKLFNFPPQPTQFIATNPTDFSTAGIGLTSYSPLTTPSLPYPATSFDTPTTPDGESGNQVLTFDINGGPYGSLMTPGQSPILDTLLRQPPSFVSEDLLTKIYNNENFDPRTPKNVGISITNINPYTGTQFVASNPTDFSTAGIGDTVYTPLQVPFVPGPSTIFDSILFPGDYISLPLISGPYGSTLFPSRTPVLDTLLREPNEFVSNDLLVKKYESENFDPRIPKNAGVKINNKNDYTGTQFVATNPTDYSTAGMDDNIYIPLIAMGDQLTENDLGKLGMDLGKSSGWEALYNSDHTPKPTNFEASTPFTPYNYGGHINRDKLNMRTPSTGGNSLMSFSPSRSPQADSTAGGGRSALEGIFSSEFLPGEPYIVSPIGDEGREINRGTRLYPVHRANTDAERLTKYLSSVAGNQFLISQNVNLAIKSSIVRITKYNTDGKLESDKLQRIPQRFNNGMSPDVPVLAAGSRLTGYGMPNILYKKNGGVVGSILEALSNMRWDPDFGGQGIGSNVTHLSTGYEVNNNDPSLPSYNLNNTFTNQSPENNNIVDQITDFVSGFGPTSSTVKKLNDKVGDLFTLMDFGVKESTADGSRYKDKLAAAHPSDSTKIESEKHGMPLYFKDMRDGAYIFFRAYIEGLTENLVSTWNPVNYIGRSNPAYTYQQGERDINFGLFIVAQSPAELQKIYKKLNKLSSLVFPEYSQDTRTQESLKKFGSVANRMKPPLCKLRIGELFGSSDNELLGFIESLSYTFPENSPWETDKDLDGKMARVPKHILANITFRVIHSEVPNMKTEFYGYQGG